MTTPPATAPPVTSARTSRIVHRLMPAVCVLLMGAVLIGCESEGGRIDAARTTQAERKSKKVLPTALLEFTDQAPQLLVSDLRDLPIIKKAKAPVTIVLGDIDNQTQIVSSNEFELAAQRLRSNLINSRVARGKFDFVEGRRRMQRLARRERVASGDYVATPPDYNPNSTFALLGDFSRIGRGNTNLYYMQFQLVHFATNRIVASPHYLVKQTTGK